MARFVVGDDRSQSTLFPERLDDYLGEDKSRLLRITDSALHSVFSGSLGPHF